MHKTHDELHLLCLSHNHVTNRRRSAPKSTPHALFTALLHPSSRTHPEAPVGMPTAITTGGATFAHTRTHAAAPQQPNANVLSLVVLSPRVALLKRRQICRNRTRMAAFSAFIVSASSSLTLQTPSSPSVDPFSGPPLASHAPLQGGRRHARTMGTGRQMAISKPSMACHGARRSGPPRPVNTMSWEPSRPAPAA